MLYSEGAGWFQIMPNFSWIYSLNLNPILTQFALYIVIILVMAYLVDFFLMRSVVGRGYRIFVAPGVIVHELSHAFFCLLTGAKITKISFFEKDGGSVTHSQSKVPIIGSILISLAPFAVGAVSIFFLSRWLGFNMSETLSKAGFNNVIDFTKNVLQGIDWKNYKNWVILYLIISIAVTMLPSFQDMKNTFLALILTGGLIFIFYKYAGLVVNLPPYWFDKMFIVLSTVIILLFIALIFSSIIYLLSKLLWYN